MATSEGTEPARSVDTIYVPVGELRENSWNPNVQSEQVRRAERESILEYGFIDPITVRPHPDGNGWEIIDGEHRFEMARELGLAEVPIIPLQLDDADARKLTVVLNETRGDADAVMLGQVLTQIQNLVGADRLPVALPYTAAELEHLLTLGAENWDAFQQGAGGDPPLPPSNLREMTLTMDPKVFDRFNKHLEVLRREWEMGEAGATDIIVEAVSRAAREANQGKRPAAKT